MFKLYKIKTGQIKSVIGSKWELPNLIFNEETNMVRTIGLVVAGIGLLLLIFSIAVDKKNGLGNIKKEFKLLTEKGYLKTHSKKGFGFSIYDQTMINPPKKRRKVSKEARAIMDRVDTAISPTNIEIVRDENDTALLDEDDTAVLDNEMDTAVLDDDDTALLDENDTAVLEEDGTALLDEESTAVLEDEDTAVLEEGTAVLDEDDDGFGRADYTTILNEDNTYYDNDEDTNSQKEQDKIEDDDRGEYSEEDDKISEFASVSSSVSEFEELKRRGTQLLVELDESAMEDTLANQNNDDDYYDFTEED